MSRPVAYLTRVVEFRATHHYFRSDWNEQKNSEVFGTSATPHAHTYRCAITVKGAVDPATGMVVDLGVLDRILAEEVVARFGGKDVNRDVAEFGAGRAQPTGEELCLDIWRRVAARLPKGCAPACVRVEEDPSLCAEYRGEGGA